MKKIIALLALIQFIGIFNASFGQELNMNVQIISPRLTNGDQTNIQNLKASLTNFLNNTQWTTENWKPEERIQCNLIINIANWDGASGYQGSAQIVSKRPIFGSSYTTTLVNINDAYFNFTYTDGQAMNFSMQNSGGDNIMTICAFYAYIILGIDRDSFQELGGTPFYNKALNILNNAQSNGGDGWRPTVMRNRYWLINNISSEDMRNFRKYMYAYHRDGLDLMSDNFTKGQNNVIKAIQLLKDINIQRNNAVFYNSYCTVKAKEITDCLSNAENQSKLAVYAILAAADPANIFYYDALKQNKTYSVIQNQPVSPKKNDQKPSFERPEIPKF